MTNVIEKYRDRADFRQSLTPTLDIVGVVNVFLPLGIRLILRLASLMVNEDHLQGPYAFSFISGNGKELLFEQS